MSHAMKRLCAALALSSVCLLCVLRSADESAKPSAKAIYNSQNATTPLTTPKAALEGVTLPKGFRIQLSAAEPDVQQPIGMAFDARGRLWVAECYTYAERQKNFDTTLKDRVVVLEDADGDGVYERRKVFWDQAHHLTSVLPGFGGVWVLCAPDLLFIPDRNGDDVPDGKPVVMLNGFDNDKIRHNIVNGLKWGPDGWLYGRHGIITTSFVGKPEASKEERTALNCGIWRYHPVLKKFEVVARGTTNSWGHDWDDHGQLFFINTVIGHLWHVVPGARYKRMYGEHFEPHLYELIEQTADHFHWDTGRKWNEARNQEGSTDTAGGGHAHCGMMIYLGDNWPAEYRGNMFTVNLHGLRLNRDTLARHGAGYVGRHAPDFMKIKDPWFRGIELDYGPDGGVYLLDWSDIGECHENDGVHRTSGRIYKIAHGAATKSPTADLSKLSNDKLVALQAHANDWQVRQARRLLQERAAEGADMTAARAQLRQMFDTEPNIPRKLRALWALHCVGGADEPWLQGLLRHPNEHVRVWAIKLLQDSAAPSASTMTAFTQLAGKENSGLVLLFLASTLQQIPPAQRWPLAEAIVQHKEFADDAVLPLMVWYGIEPAVAQDRVRAVQFVPRCQFPKVRQFVTRRLTAESGAAGGK
ncbi:MAG: hypothetical protein EXS22_10470 [Pedosphaera sp.]|nr:hypothetical protein [Pedosphaera sp.]